MFMSKRLGLDLELPQLPYDGTNLLSQITIFTYAAFVVSLFEP